MDHKFSEIDHVTPLFNLFLVVHLPTHSATRQLASQLLLSSKQSEPSTRLPGDVDIFCTSFCSKWTRTAWFTKKIEEICPQNVPLKLLNKLLDR